MNSKLEGLFSAFSSKLLGDEKLYTFVTDKAELAGLEPGFVASLAAAAEANGKPGQWAIKNTRSSAQPVLQNRSEEQTYVIQSLMRTYYDVSCLNKNILSYIITFQLHTN